VRGSASHPSINTDYKMKNSEIYFKSPLSLEECLDRLTGSIERPWLPALGSKPLAGKVIDNRIRIRKRINYLNSFQTVFNAALKETKNGTVIEGRFGLSTLVIMIVGLTILLILISDWLVYIFSNTYSPSIFLLCFISGIIFFGK